MNNKELTTINGVLFDWDLTLARAVGDVTRSARLAALFTSKGFPCSQEATQQAMLTYQQHIDQNEQIPDNPPPQTQPGIIQYYMDLLQIIGYPDVTWQQATDLYHAYALLPTNLYDDVLPTFQALQGRGLLLGIVSNHTPYARDMMEQLVGGFVKPQHIIISDEVGFHKPSEAIFQQALARLQIPAHQCIFVGDNLEVDAIGAIEQGGFRWGLWLDRNSVDRKAFSFPDKVARITSLTQVLNYL